MLEGLVAWVLNTYLGRYVENLNTDQLSIALLSGEVELENLPLKKNAFNNLGIPIRVQAGFVGKIKLQIPLRQIRSAPWVIIIEQLYIVATPINLYEWDNEFEQSIYQENKLNLLDALEAQWRAETDSNPGSGYYATSFSSWMSYGTSLVTNIIENLQLKIKDVHLRYEDKLTCGDKNPFACGLIMESFSAESCDSDWQRTFTTFSSNQTNDCSFKLLELQKIGFYWDQISSKDDVFSNLSLGELAVRMCGKVNNHQFIINPVSALAQLKRERCEQPIRSRSKPRLTCYLSLDEMPIFLSDKQYSQIVRCFNGLITINQIKGFRRKRPNCTVSTSPKAWWIYAVKCFFPEFSFMDAKPTWENCITQAKQCVKYVDLYTTLLKTPTVTISSDDKNFKDKFETLLSFEQLKLLRESAMRRIPKKPIANDVNTNNVTHDKVSVSSRSMLIQWFPQWWGWYNTTNSQDTSNIPLKSISESTDLEDEILDVIADSIENNSLLKRDSVFGMFEFMLCKGSIQLSTSYLENYNYINKVMLELHFENVGFSVITRPRTSSHTLNVTLGSVCLKDYLTENTFFPTLVSSQGSIRDSLCSLKLSTVSSNVIKPTLSNNTLQKDVVQESLFQLIYESKPFNMNCDYRLFVKSQSLEIVYNPQVVRWFSDFLSLPLSLPNAKLCNDSENFFINGNTTYAHVKNTTKMHIMNQWENILQGDLGERSVWNIELDISAPQIFLIESFIDKNGLVAVLDFGKMYVSNKNIEKPCEQEITEDDDNEMFMTPCSTPPVSEVSDFNLTECGTSPIPPDTPQPPFNSLLNQDALHHRIYDKYKVEFRELQILIGKIKDNWRFSNTKGTSALHIIDRFNILLQIERRVIYTSDPQFPSVTISGSLPNLIVHINEHKLLYIQSLISILNSSPYSIKSDSLTSSLQESNKYTFNDENVHDSSDKDITERSLNQSSRLLMLQFIIDQMTLEVQSQGRSIAEIQVCGVKAAFTKRIYDIHLSLSVHSFLLVDALQTYGPDFELLIASHKHVGIDTVSGSIKDSEPTSPISPSSPPENTIRTLYPPPPSALSQALYSLNTKSSSSRLCVSPVADAAGVPVIGAIDSEALIVVEITIVSSDCPSSQGEELIISNILFNNLDIIANQETIVELIGFAKRLASISYSGSKLLENSDSNMNLDEVDSVKSDSSDRPMIRNEITFDFHRLSVLLLRASIEDGNVVGKKIATATMCDAKIGATICNSNLELTGSLGGLQVVSLCSGTSVHHRILSVGHDPLINRDTFSYNLISSLSQEVYKGISDKRLNSEEEKAFSFKITKQLISSHTNDCNSDEDFNVNICLRMASVWYIHSGMFIGEIQSCVSEFKQYLSNLAKSIKTAAKDMAMGLVNPRNESLHSSTKILGSTEWLSPRRSRLISTGPQDNEELEKSSFNANINLDIVLETPVVVLPRSSNSTEVFVARLGNISITNKLDFIKKYLIQVKDINIYSLDVNDHLNNSGVGSSIETIFKCNTYGKPILHDTTIQFDIEQGEVHHELENMCKHSIKINGKVVTPLKISATRQQYEQLLETLNTLGVSSPNQLTPEQTSSFTRDSTEISALNMDPQLKARIINTYASKQIPSESFQHIKVCYQLPVFTIELRGDFGKGEQSVVNLSFRDFFVKYKKCYSHETSIEMSLRSITMEDLLRDINSRHRFMMLSHKSLIPKSDFMSHSNPDLNNLELDTNKIISKKHNRCSSLPSQLANKDTSQNSTINITQKSEEFEFNRENLVLISIHIVEPSHSLFSEKYKNVRKTTKVNFNSLDLVISIDSWVVLLDFFGSGGNLERGNKNDIESVKPESKIQKDNFDKGDTEMEISVQSLNVVLLRPQYEVCRANISKLNVLLKDMNCNNKNNVSRYISGTLGSMSMLDLSPHGHIWRERFLSFGKEALNFQYERFAIGDALPTECDSKLSIEMSSIVFVHTKRFIGEIQTFFREFSQLQSVFSQARQKVSVTANSQLNRMKISINCHSPAILIPVSSNSTSLLVAELDKLTVNNEFKKAGSDGTISTIRDLSDAVRELLDVMMVNLNNMDLYCGEKCNTEEIAPLILSRKLYDGKKYSSYHEFGPNTIIQQHGPFLLTDKCGLTIQVEKNLETYHNVPDMSIHGTLDTLNGSIDLEQYKVIKGLLSNNIGENIDDLYLFQNSSPSAMGNDEKIWTLMSIRFDLLNVILRLENQHGISSLACINFIKSRLLVETFSDMTQDIDLVSQEILLSDIRYKTDPVNKRSNVFSNIVIPMGMKKGNKSQHSVQAEVHARKRKEHSAYTILVNSMRLMAIIDWWQAVNKFIMSPANESNNQRLIRKENTNLESEDRSSPVNDSQFELKVNITDSQIVFVEDTSQWDTNAVILKSTIVISYKPGSETKPLSCVLNHCEVFSCVLGMEEETALSIIDPVNLQIDLTIKKVLQVQLPQLFIRLSYHDVCMLNKMFHSLPKQTLEARTMNHKNPLPANKNKENIKKLLELGFSVKDCEKALLLCEGEIEQAAYWLTENSKIISQNILNSTETQTFELVQVKADCISVCIIDDCRDSDVPLLELSLLDMSLSQDIRFTNLTNMHTPQSPPLCLSPEDDSGKNIINENMPGSGRIQCRFTSDYYNRALSGWEPFIEPWSCDASWELTATNNSQRNKLRLEINSTEILNINITNMLTELYYLVKNNWTQDYYSLSNRNEISLKLSPPGYRRRSPFIPFALRNLTGCKLWFTTIVTTADVISKNIELSDPDESWIEVLPDNTVPFKFGERGKQRHRDSHKLRLHQLGVHIDGWNSVSPVCVDKVGVFFRQVTHMASSVEARLVFAVTLEGSAQKLITIRSALQLVNNLPVTIEVRTDNNAPKDSGSLWCNVLVPKPRYINSGDIWCVPLLHNPSPMWIRPMVMHQSPTSSTTSPTLLYCSQPLDWRLAAQQSPRDCLQIPHVCYCSNTSLTFRFCCILRREMFPLEKGIPQPGHTLILKPPVQIINLLPIELNFQIAQSDHTINRIAPGQTAPLLEIDVQKLIEISIYLEGFPGMALLSIPPSTTDSFSSRLKLSDTSDRKLTLNAYVSIKKTDSIKISISSPFWIINRTGIPIVFRQEGIPTETAGQFEEHEIARMIAPLLFSFADSDGSPTVIARVGTGVIQNGTSQWCLPFGLSPGIMVRRLIVSNINSIGGNEKVLLLGIAIRSGRGRYRHTNICTISPRYQIHNNTSFHLQFAQKCYATTITDPGAASTYISATPKCSIPFHWPNHDQNLLLCVKITNVPNCNWSGGFQIDTNHSLHINIRDGNATCYFLRVEVILQGATYFIVFTDADTMPPPIRIDNFAHVHLHFHQLGCKEESLIKAHSSKPWALIEPCGTATLAIRAPGGTRTTINLQKLDETKSLSYQNFIYIAFTGTHQSNYEGKENSVENSQLVLEVANNPSCPGVVILARKRDGERAQLWRFNKHGHLLHEGSSPPQPANAPPDVNAPHSLVLDIEGSAPQPSMMVGLCVRRVHPRRASTQTWRFTPDGRLRCGHNNMNVQPLDGFFGLREGNRAVLGMPGTAGPHILPNGIPIEHAISSQTLRPGSGSLEVTVTTDGPTRVIKIFDTEEKLEHTNRQHNEINDSDTSNRETQVCVAMGGIGISLIANNPSEELVFCQLSGVLLEAIWNHVNQRLNLSIQNVQIDNQLLGTPCPVLLYTTKSKGNHSEQTNLPVIHLSTELISSPPNTRYNTQIFKHLIVSLRPISVHLEERLLLKMCLWIGISGIDNNNDKEEPDETDFETQKILTEITAVHAKRYYFGVLKLVPNQIRLSMQTASKLSPNLLIIKKRLGLRLIKFEDAGVELESFIRCHPFETSQFLWHSIIKHYKDELKWQAAIILGSVDFLGNPLGFMQDVSDGVSGLIFEGNFRGLVKNVAHGLSNSAAKVSESLGDGLGHVILDEAHEETRARIRGIGEGGGTNHLVAGLRGLGLGLLGGVTSLVKHTYEGAAHQGLPGFFTGVGRGLIGTVTKPVVGVLDLAAETAAAVRDTSRRSDRWLPERSRPPRSPMGPGGLLPRYSSTQSIGYQYLYIINGRNYEEGFLAYDCISGQSSDIRALISTQYFRVFTCISGEPQIVIEAHLSHLISCQVITNAIGESYIELTLKVDGTGGLGIRHLQVQCDTSELAQWVSHQVNYAKSMFYEMLFTLQDVYFE